MYMVEARNEGSAERFGGFAEALVRLPLPISDSCDDSDNCSDNCDDDNESV